MGCAADTSAGAKGSKQARKKHECRGGGGGSSGEAAQRVKVPKCVSSSAVQVWHWTEEVKAEGDEGSLPSGQEPSQLPKMPQHDRSSILRAGRWPSDPMGCAVQCSKARCSRTRNGGAQSCAADVLTTKPTHLHTCQRSRATLSLIAAV